VTEATEPANNKHDWRGEVGRQRH